MEIQQQTSTSRSIAHLFCFICSEHGGLLSTLFAQFQLGFPKGLFRCSVGIDKIPRIKAMPTFSAFKCANIFSLPSLLVPSCLADICPHQQPCTCGGRRGRSMIPCARAALASVGRSNAPTSTSALELFVRYGTLALLRLATTAPVNRKKSHPTLRKNKCAHQ